MKMDEEEKISDPEDEIEKDDNIVEEVTNDEDAIPEFESDSDDSASSEYEDVASVANVATFLVGTSSRYGRSISFSYLIIYFFILSTNYQFIFFVNIL
jgi:hypothetical protein